MDQQLVNAIKDIALSAVKSLNISNTHVGEVVSIDPLSIKLVDSNVPIPAENIDVVDTLGYFEKTYTGTCQGTAQIPSLSGTCYGEYGGSISTNPDSAPCSGTCEVKVIIDNRLKVGDQVHMVRKTGGRKFLVVGRIQ